MGNIEEQMNASIELELANIAYKRMTLDTNAGLVALVAILVDKGIINETEFIDLMNDRVKKQEDMAKAYDFLNKEEEYIKHKKEKMMKISDLFNL